MRREKEEEEKRKGKISRRSNRAMCVSRHVDIVSVPI